MKTASKARVAWITLGAGVALIVVVLTGMSVWSWLARQTETQRETHQRPVGRIELDLGIGEAQLVAGEPGRIDIERQLTWSGTKPTLDEQWDGDTFRVRANCDEDFGISACGVKYTIRVPSGTTVDARTSEGDITLSDLDGSLRLTTATGAITGTGLRAATVEAGTQMGDIGLKFVQAPGSLRTSSETGDIDLEVPEGTNYALDLGGGLGEQTVGVRATAYAANTISVRNSTGAIRVVYLGS
jgi:hypothetical protein